MGDEAENGSGLGWRSPLAFVAGVVAYIVVADWIEAVVAGAVTWLVSVGGYGLSNAVVGALVAGLCLFLLRRIRRWHRKLEAEGDPEPLRPPYEYEPPAKAMLWLGWIAGVVCWGFGVFMAVFGLYEVVVVGPILGTAAIAGGRMGIRHARAMDAGRGWPRAPAERGR